MNKYKKVNWKAFQKMKRDQNNHLNKMLEKNLKLNYIKKKNKILNFK